MKKSNAKAVIAVAPDGSETFYPSCSAAAEAIGVHPSRISAACLTDTPCRGLLWHHATREEAARAKSVVAVRK